MKKRGVDVNHSILDQRVLLRNKLVSSSISLIRKGGC